MLMFCKDISSSTIIVDFTGPTEWLNSPANSQAVYDLLEKGPYLLFCDVSINHPENVFAYLCDSSEDIEKISSEFIHSELENGECDAIVITNNADRIRLWTELNYSTIFLDTENNLQNLQREHMPDEVWEIQHLIDFVYDDFASQSYFMEVIGLKNADTQPVSYFKFEDINQINGVQYDVIFAGRSFKVSDNRQYIHLLSRALKEFKYEVRDDLRSSRKTLFRLLDKLLLKVISDNTDITAITAVPPRPSQQHRFFGFEEFYSGNIPLNFDILKTVVGYPTPKQYRTYGEKYNCVQNAFDFTENVEGHIILLDDIYTTGVTTSECVKMLLKAGASKVTVVPLAYTQSCPSKQYLIKGLISEDAIEYVPRFYNSNGENFWIKRDNGKSSYNYDYVSKKYIEQNSIWHHIDTSEEHLQDYFQAKAIIFDLDNTLIETDALESIRYNNAFSQRDEEFMLDHSTPLISTEIIKHLINNGIKIGIVTRSKKAYAEKILKLYNYDYDILISRFSCFRTKPFPDPFICCAYHLNIQPKYILTVGNEPSDKYASHAANMAAFILDDTGEIEVLTDLLKGLVAATKN